MKYRLPKAVPFRGMSRFTLSCPEPDACTKCPEYVETYRSVPGLFNAGCPCVWRPSASLRTGVDTLRANGLAASIEQSYDRCRND
jgi:hypothetical protein